MPKHLIGCLQLRLSPIHMHLDFEIFIFRRETFSKLFLINTCKSDPNDASSLNMPVMSSAYCNNLISLFPSLIPWISVFHLIAIAKISAVIIKRYGDKGSPWRTPLSSLKNSDLTIVANAAGNISINRPTFWNQNRNWRPLDMCEENLIQCYQMFFQSPKRLKIPLFQS